MPFSSLLSSVTIFHSTMFYKKSIHRVVLGSSFSSPIFGRGIRKDASVNLFAASEGALDIFGIAKLSGAKVTDSSAHRRTLHGHVHTSAFAAYLVVFISVEVNGIFSALLYPYPFQCGEDSGISSALDNLRSIRYYAWDTQTMIPQSLVHSFGENVPLPTYVEGGVTEMATAYNVGTSETTDTALQVIKFWCRPLSPWQSAPQGQANQRPWDRAVR